MLKRAGFTLAELLIALVILGLIATFTIPKVLQSQQNSQFKAVGKETVSMVSGAFQAYQQSSTVTAGTNMDDLTPFMNYVKLDSTTIIDYVATQANQNCSLQTCYRLHNGAIIWWWGTSDTFQGTSSTHALEFYVEPDSKYSGSTSGPGKSEQFYIYTSGRITTRPGVNNPTWVNGSSYGPTTTFVSDWFSWD